MNNKSVFSNFIWRFAERCGAQIVTFIVSMVLARILMPEDYGTVTLVTVFTTIMQVFVDSGLSTALIQKKDADDLDFSSVFYFNFVMCIILYSIMFFVAPIISSFYNMPELVSVVRVVSLTIVISGIKGVQQAYVSRNMLFKRFFYATLGGTIFSGILGIVLAYAGLGVWAIVVQQLSNTAIDTLILWVTIKWRPKRMFSWERLKGLLGFGWKMLCSSLFDTGYNNLRNLLIGKIYSASALAYYDQGDKLSKIIVTNINTSIDSVLLPAMSNEQDDKNRVKNMVRRSIMVSCYMMAPLMIGLTCCAKNVVTLIYTEKWVPCVFYLQIFCITYMFWPIHTANLNAIKAMGRSDLFLRLEICKKVIGIILLIATMFISVEAMAYSLLISTLTSMIINSWPNKMLLDYSFLEQMKDILPSILIAAVMGGVVCLIGLLNIPTLPLVLIQIISGGGLYVVLSAIVRLESFVYLYGIIKSMLIKRRKV